MQSPRLQQQAGYALILVVLGLMGLGGVVLSGFTQQARQDVEKQRYEHNQRVLQQAKQALLMYAYNYPQIALTELGTVRGPGRLPCPDTNNSGTDNNSFNCIFAGDAMVGRFPWNAAGMNFYEARDASGEHLWYAVSQNFARSIAGVDVINSDTTGTITVVDQSGGILYDGDGAGIAAIIIAPGPIIRRDANNDGVYEYVQVRATAPQRLRPENYLDTLFVQGAGANNEFDNSVFINSESDTNDDGFILGPVFDPDASEFVVNDQMIIVTADEVIAMAEKAVLETYRDAIAAYQETLWGAPPNPNYRYPWLSAYDDTTDLDIYNARPGETSGRVPFIDYFVDENSPHSVIVSDLEISYDLHTSYNSMVDNNDPFDPTYIAAASDIVSDYPDSDQTINISNARVSFSRTSFDGLNDVSTDNIGTLIVQDSGTSAITATTYPSNTATRYFWDGCPTCFEAADGWELCDNGGQTAGDCAKDNNPPYGFVPFTGNWDDHADIALRMIEFQYIDTDFVIELDYLPAPGVNPPTLPTAADHARRQYTFNENEVTLLPIVDPAEPDTRNFFDIKVSMCDQDNFVGSGLNLFSLGNEDANTVLCTVDLQIDITSSYHDPLVITVDWYPPLPRWVSDNRWDETIMLSYMPDFAPGGDGACTADLDPANPAPDDCLVVSNQSGINNDFNAVLILAGEHDLLDGDDLNFDGDYADADEDLPDSDFSNDLQDVFEPENYSGLWPHPVPNNDPTPASDSLLPRIFDKREETVPGNRADTVFVLN